MLIRGRGFDDWYHKGIGAELAEEVKAMGYPAVEYLLPDLFEWLHDMNWPGACKIADFLVSIGEPIVPYLKRILSARDYEDHANVIYYVVQELPPEIIRQLEDELIQLAWASSPGELSVEILDICASNGIGHRSELMRLVLDNWVIYRTIFEHVDKISRSSYLSPVKNIFDRYVNTDDTAEKRAALNELLGYDGEKYSEDSFITKKINKYKNK